MYETMKNDFIINTAFHYIVHWHFCFLWKSHKNTSARVADSHKYIQTELKIHRLVSASLICMQCEGMQKFHYSKQLNTKL